MEIRHALIPGAVMRHLPLWLTVLLLGGLPLTAAALDYGPNRTLLAAENGAPQLPVLQQRDAPNGAMPKPEVMTAASAENPVAAEPRMTPSSASPVGAARPSGATASSKSRGANPEQPAPGPATWQSLLPGSIQ
jgi:hypothetical protein